MSSLTVRDIIEFITGEALDQDIVLIQKCINLRNRTQHEMRTLENAHTIYQGDRVLLHSLKPNYLNGMVAYVTSVNGDDSTFSVEVSAPDWPSSRSRNRRVPFSCVRKA